MEYWNGGILVQEKNKIYTIAWIPLNPILQYSNTPVID
jgi:hypothetical protein